MSTVIFGIARSLLVFYVLVNSSQTLHNKMFESILRAPVLFFDRNPIGKSDTKLIGKYVLTHLMSRLRFTVGKWRHCLEPNHFVC